MEDEFTRRMNLRISEIKQNNKQHLLDKNITDYSISKGEIKGLEYAKQIYIAMALRDKKQ